MDLSTYRPTKNWRKRIWWWVVGLALLISFIHMRLWEALPVWVVVFILIDEYLKEGYLFDLHDVKKPFTHENLAVIVSAILTFGVLLKRLKRRGKHDKNEDNGR